MYVLLDVSLQIPHHVLLFIIIIIVIIIYGDLFRRVEIPIFLVECETGGRVGSGTAMEEGAGCGGDAFRHGTGEDLVLGHLHVLHKASLAEVGFTAMQAAAPLGRIMIARHSEESVWWCLWREVLSAHGGRRC
jgi:hypothetical protein